MVRRSRDHHQFARVHPVQFTPGTIVDHYVSRAGIVVSVHGAAALGALNVPLQFLGIGWMRDGREIRPMRPKVAQYQNKGRRGNQTATATSTVKNLVRLENGVRQGNGTHRAGKL